MNSQILLKRKKTYLIFQKKTNILLIAMNMHSLGGYHVIVAMQAEKEVLLNAQGSASISVAQFPGIRFSYLETALFCGCVYAAKKPTRKWAAWTHQEEECFFTALRHVGKNFLKITSRVLSKNKDQVVDMLHHVPCRWSLLEKHSCKASKLHLKPRRFKLFLEALEHQLLKDSRKSISKRACHGETFSSVSLENISSHSRERGLDNRPLKMILCDSQNVKKLGPGRSSTKHGDSLGVIDSECVDPPATEGSHCLLRDVSFASDSFDAAIAAHILRHQNKPPSVLLQVPSGSSSIWG
ncbi:unnamed protein product [Brassica rapa]|uniref:Myb-like domain-containing protein n=2 Tax=Brassica TaxID=3705 RepID=A0A8D9I2E8_BRACM|nr:unnamed protein product [Brassica napus]CAG7908046.1 unnamed protein product [Brassica rapa]